MAMVTMAVGSWAVVVGCSPVAMRTRQRTTLLQISLPPSSLLVATTPVF